MKLVKKMAGATICFDNFNLLQKPTEENSLLLKIIARFTFQVRTKEIHLQIDIDMKVQAIKQKILDEHANNSVMKLGKEGTLVALRIHHCHCSPLPKQTRS